MFIAIILWVVFAFVVAAGARNRGRSGFGWFILSIIISPILSGLALVFLGNHKKEVE